MDGAGQDRSEMGASAPRRGSPQEPGRKAGAPDLSTGEESLLRLIEQALERDQAKAFELVCVLERKREKTLE